MSGANVLIRGGSVASSTDLKPADVRIRAGMIAAVGAGLADEGESVIDARGLVLLPGVIDAHSHQWEAGLASRPDFRDDTSSAAAGGITTIIDHPLTPPEVVNARRLRDKVVLGNRTSFVDFALHGGVGSGDLAHLPELWDAGVTSFKLFTCDTGAEMAGFTEPRMLAAALSAIANLRAIAIVHAEDQQILDANRQRLEAEGRRDARFFGEWHSPEAELSAITKVLAAAVETQCSVYFVHTSVPEGVEAVTSARASGVAAMTETCPHYLYLTQTDIERQGHRATTSPPVRDTERRTRLRGQLASSIAVVGSDHGAVMPEHKATRDAFEGQPGLPGNETMVPLMLNLVREGAISVTRLCSLLAENPARIFGLSRSKGFIKPGYDGDVTLVDLDGETVISAASLVGVAGWTPYDGWRLWGRVVRTIVRGRTVALDGRLISDSGYGHFLPREHEPLLV